MHRIEGPKGTRTRALSIVAAAGVAVTFSSSSCFFGTATSFCEATGLRCDQGQVCAPRQGICVNADGCGNGALDPGEDCDDGDIIDGNGCDSNCKATGCGNGIMSEGEQCDLGPMNSNDSSCLLNCKMAVCGDDEIQAGVEKCDDGPMNSNTGRCLTNCQPARCGDGYIRVDAEMCDDGNIEECGSCNVSCTEIRLANATGFVRLQPGGTIDEDDYFELSDGEQKVRFVYTYDGTASGTNVPIMIQMTGDSPPKTDPDVFVESTVAEINGSVLKITAMLDGTQTGKVSLIHDQPGVVGNVTMVKSGTDLAVMGMEGGKGADCLGGVTCKSNEDCRSNVCRNGACSFCGDGMRDMGEDCDPGDPVTATCAASASCKPVGDANECKCL